jgi:hypothetical protein
MGARDDSCRTTIGWIVEDGCLEQVVLECGSLFLSVLANKDHDSATVSSSQHPIWRSTIANWGTHTGVPKGK